MQNLIVMALVVCLLVVGCASSTTLHGPQLLDRAMKRAIALYEEAGLRPVSSQVLPFDSRVPGTMKWLSVWDHGGQRVDTFKILAEFPPGFVLQLSLAPPDEELARKVLDTLQAKRADAECYWPVFREMTKKHGVASDEAERRFRAAAAAGVPEEAMVGGPSQAIIFSNGGSNVCYTYAVPGRWGPGDQPSLLKSLDGRREVGVLFWEAHGL